VSLNVIERPGSRVPFLLVHGLASNARLWDGVGSRLEELGHRSVAVDQRGHGLSDKPDTGYDFTTITNDLAALIRAVGFDRPMVAGQSWGGNVVVELAWRYPSLVRGIACVDGGTIELSSRFSEWEDCKAAMTPPKMAGMPLDRLETGLRKMHPDWPESGIAGTLANFEVRSDGTVAPWLTLDRHLQILRAMWEQKPSSLFPSIEVPVLLVPARGGVGGMDKSKSIEAAAAALRQSRVEWFDADHDIHAQFPVVLADLFHQCVVEGFFS
jgi:pimeloyl-ACP methyl ester carboxylesterase